MTKEHQKYGSCPVLDRKNRTPMKSNITYIETRSIVRGCSNDQLNQNNHSNSMIIPLQTNSLSTRVIRETEE
jgi:hypothetical protein